MALILNPEQPTSVSIPARPILAQEENAGCPITILPNELLARILSLLTDPLDQECAQLVCCQFYALSKCAFLQRELESNRLRENGEFDHAIQEAATKMPPAGPGHALIDKLYQSFKKCAPVVFYNCSFLHQTEVTIAYLEKRWDEKLIRKDKFIEAEGRFIALVLQDILNERIQKEGLALLEPGQFFHLVNEIQKKMPINTEEAIALSLEEMMVPHFYCQIQGEVNEMEDMFYNRLLAGQLNENHYLLLVLTVTNAVAKLDPQQKRPISCVILQLLLINRILAKFQDLVANRPNAVQIQAYLESRINNLRMVLIEVLANGCNPLKGYEDNDLKFLNQYHEAIKFYNITSNPNNIDITGTFNQIILEKFNSNITFIIANLRERIVNTQKDPNNAIRFILRKIRSEKIQNLTEELKLCEKRFQFLREKSLEANPERLQNKIGAQLQRNKDKTEELSRQLEALQQSPDIPDVPKNLTDKEKTFLNALWSKTLNEWNETIQLLTNIEIGIR